MRKYVKKFFWAWESEKEEHWLNEMSAKGLALVDYCWCRYSFEECEPGEYSYKIQLLEHRPSHPESEQYIRFMEETGAEQVASYINWVYFRRKNSEGPFELFSDVESKIKHLSLIRNLFIPLAIVNLFIAIVNFINFGLNSPKFLWVPLINFAVLILLEFAASHVNKKIKKFKEEQIIHE